MALKLLVVDDNPGDQRLMREAMEDVGLECEIICAHTGHEAVQMAVMKRPDLILLDILIPGLSGGEVARLIKKNLQTMGIPIVFISGVVARNDEGSDRGVMINQERYPCLAKPVDARKLLDVINSLITRS